MILEIVAALAIFFIGLPFLAALMTEKWFWFIFSIGLIGLIFAAFNLFLFFIWSLVLITYILLLVYASPKVYRWLKGQPKKY